ARRVALGAARRGRPLVPHRPTGGRRVAARGGTRLAHRAVAARAVPRRGNARHEPAAGPAQRGGLAAGPPLLPDHRRALWAGSLAAADHQGLIAIERSRRRPALGRAGPRCGGGDGRGRSSLRPDRGTAPPRGGAPRGQRLGFAATAATLDAPL